MRCDAADMCAPPAAFCFFRPTNEQMKVNPNISTFIDGICLWNPSHDFGGKKKPIERKIYRYIFMPIKRLIDLGRLQWLWFMFYYRKEMLIFLKIKFINISLEDIKGPSIMGLVQAIHSCMTYLRAALNAL